MTQTENASNIGYVVILAGSDSDKAHVRKIADSLDIYGIPSKVRICSAHKQLEKLRGLIKDYNEDSDLVAIVAVAGGTDALSGTLSYHAHFPVISCPPDVPNQSCLTNPSGSSNAYIARPENVGKFIAQICAHKHPRIKEILYIKNIEKIESLERADLEARTKGEE